jgi:hypothetical protein
MTPSRRRTRGDQPVTCARSAGSAMSRADPHRPSSIFRRGPTTQFRKYAAWARESSRSRSTLCADHGRPRTKPKGTCRGLSVQTAILMPVPHTAGPRPCRSPIKRSSVLGHVADDRVVPDPRGEVGATSAAPPPVTSANMRRGHKNRCVQRASLMSRSHSPGGGKRSESRSGSPTADAFNGAARHRIACLDPCRRGTIGDPTEPDLYVPDRTTEEETCPTPRTPA